MNMRWERVKKDNIENTGLDVRLVCGALVIFVMTEILAVVGNSLLGRGFSLDRSISRYVGFGLWSSLIFALGNFVVAFLVSKYLWKVGAVWRMPRSFYYLVVTMAIGLIGLSFCPLGIADVNGEVGMVSHFHQVFSRLMFLMMLLVAIAITLNQRTNDAIRTVCMVFVTYGIICMVGMLGELAWFTELMLVWETMFFVLFMGLMLILPFGRKRDR